MKKPMRFNIPIRVITFFLLLLIFNSCNEDAIEKQRADSGVSINTNGSYLNNRVRIPAFDEIMSVNDIKISTPNGRFSSSTPSQSNYALVLRAEVEPPVSSGNILRASHVYIDGDKAFVSYNTEGPVYRGGFEVFDISNIKEPSLIYQYIVEGSEYSAVYYEEGRIFLAGATENTEVHELNSNAILEVISYPEVEGQSNRLIDVSSFTATDVKVHGDFIYVTSGSHGGLSIYDKNSYEKVLSTGLDDARSIAFNDNFYVLMQGTPARVKIYNIADNSFVNGYTVGGADIPESKSIVSITNDKIFVPTGREGLKVIDFRTGEILHHMGLPSMEDVDSELLVTNGVSVNAEKIFSANGAAGMYLSEQQAEQMSLVGNVEFSASTNYVQSKGNVMFVATGVGGLKIIEIVEYNPGEGDYIPIGEWDDNGTPEYLCEKATPVSQKLQDMISNTFADKKDILSLKPQYFGSEVITDLTFNEDTDLKITFYSETAGWTNTFGYYLYDPLNPPNNVNEIDNMTVVYPNSSAQGSKGELVKGDKVCLENLKKGSALGFFLVAKGWNNGAISSGIGTNYSTQVLNTIWPSHHRQANLLLNTGNENIILLSFEDNRLPGADMDFDDVVFLLEPTNPESIDYDQLIPLQ